LIMMRREAPNARLVIEASLHRSLWGMNREEEGFREVVESPNPHDRSVSGFQRVQRLTLSMVILLDIESRTVCRTQMRE